MRKITKITDAQAARFGEWARKWIDIGLSTAPADFDRATEAALRAYALCNIGRPMVVLRMGSPYAATLGGAIAVCILAELVKRAPQVRSQVRSQVGSQVGSQVWSQVWSQVRSQVESQVGSQVRSQVGSQVWSQVRSQVGSQVGSQVRSQVGSQVGSQVESQVWSQVRSQVRSQVGSQVRSQVGSQVWSQVESQVWSQVRSQVGSGAYNSRGGMFWADWCAYVSFFRDVLGWHDPMLGRFEIDEALTQSVGWAWWHENVLALSDRPRAINRDDRGRLHCATGPSITYPDGWSLWHWHGVAVPQDVIENPAGITVERIKGENNAEVRRVLIERYGYERYIADARLQLVDQCGADHKLVGLRTARLFRDGDLVLLDVLNSTPEPDGSVRRYVLPIDPAAYDGRAARDCLAAVASTWRKRSDPTQLYFARPEDYQPMLES